MTDARDSSSTPGYEVAVIGGGPAGMTTALYTTRLGHRTAVFEKQGGRHAAVTHVHNLLGVSEDVSGRQLSELATRQLETYGGDFYPDAVESVEQVEDGSSRFHLEGAHATAEADRVVFATGFRDRTPGVPELLQFTGHGLYYCLHCDAYTLGDASAFVLGHNDHAASLAMKLLNFTADVDLLLDGHDPAWDDETDRLLDAHPIDRVDEGVVSVTAETDGDESAPARIGGLEFADGERRDYRGGFAVYGSEFNSDLAADLGCDLTDEGAIAVDERRETSVDGAYAVGDVTHGQNQTPIAVGDGAYAGIAIHEDLRRFPLSLEEIEDHEAEAGDGGENEETALEEGVGAPGAPDDLRARMRRVRDLETIPGLREPVPDR